MRILFVISGLSVGGAQRSMISVCTELSKRNDVAIYIGTWSNENDKYSIPAGINVIDYGRYEKTANSKKDYFLSILAIRRSIKNIRADIIVAVQCNMYPRVYIASRCLRVKTLVWEHTSMSRKMDFEATIARRYLYPMADGVVVLTNKDADIIKNKYKKSFVMPNPLPFEVYTKENNRENIVIAIGRLDVWHIKGFDTLIEIWSEINKSAREWKLYIVGEGNDKSTKYIESLVSKYNLNDSIVLTGYRKDIPQLLQQSKIFVLPSRIEGFPMGLIEAMSQGCACVSFSIDNAVADIISNNIDGIIIEDRDCKSFVKELQELINNEKRLQELSSNAVENIQRFRCDKIADMWLDIFKKL